MKSSPADERVQQVVKPGGRPWLRFAAVACLLLVFVNLHVSVRAAGTEFGEFAGRPPMVGSVEDDDWEADLWTDAKRDAFLASGERAIAVLQEHLALVAACSSEADEPRIDASAERLREAYIALSQAEFEYSSTLAPFSMLETEDDEEDLEEVPLDPETEHNQISILLRRDYAVTSGADVLRAGREAYSKVWPDDTAEQANEDVQDLGRALYQVMHAGGVDALDETPGLQPTAGVVLTVAREQLISGADLDSIVENPSDLFTVDGEILHSQSDVW